MRIIGRYVKWVGGIDRYRPLAALGAPLRKWDRLNLNPKGTQGRVLRHKAYSHPRITVPRLPNNAKDTFRMKAMPMQHAMMAMGPHMGVWVHPMQQTGGDYQRAYRAALVNQLMGSQRMPQSQTEQAPAPMGAPPRMY